MLYALRDLGRLVGVGVEAGAAEGDVLRFYHGLRHRQQVWVNIKPGAQNSMLASGRMRLVQTCVQVE